MKKDILELIALDSIVLIICAIKLQDYLVIAQIIAALAATAYSMVRIYDWFSKRKND